jgi:hypothetical protein
MGNEPKVLFWRGRNVGDLTKEELITALKNLMTAYEMERKHHQDTLDLWRDSRDGR